MDERHLQKGVTLTELMVIIAIVSIVAAVAAPNLVGYFPNWRVKNAATDLFSNILLARTTAIRESRDSTVSFFQSPDRYTVTCDGRTLKSVTLADYKSGVRFKTLSAGSLVFTPSGFANSSFSTRLTNSGETRHYTVRALVSGVVNMKKE